MTTQQFILKSEKETADLAVQIARNIKPGDILTFSGDLGSGKTFLCREIIKELCGHDTKVISPTFNLLQIYERKDAMLSLREMRSVTRQSDDSLDPHVGLRPPQDEELEPRPAQDDDLKLRLTQDEGREKFEIYHFDLYRLKTIDEIYELGIEEAFAGHVCLIEWPEIISNILPKDTISIEISIVNETTRLVVVST